MTRCEILSDTVALYCGDCRDIMPMVGRVDVVVTDPPYGERTHKGARTRLNGAGEETGNEVLIDFASIGEGEFIDLCRRLVDTAERWVVMTCEWQYGARIEASGLPLIRLGVWTKPNSAPQFTGDRPATGWEAVAILHRSGVKRWNGGGRRAVWNVPVVAGEHPTQKPLALISEFVGLFSDAGETVLDPFMGAGTTGVSCVKLGRRFVGIEIEPRYFDVACRRIGDALKQPDLFFKSPSSPKQERMDL